MNSAELRQAAAEFKAAGMRLIEAVDDRALQKHLALRIKALRAAVDEFADYAIQMVEMRKGERENRL